MGKLIAAAVSGLVLLVSLVLSAVNFARLEAKPDAPSLGQLAGFVGIPLVLALVALAVLAVALILYVMQAKATPPGRRPDPGTEPGGLVALIHPKDPQPGEVAKRTEPDEPDRSRVWAIMDELAAALRDDPDGCEAMFVVRERYHRLQFSPAEPAEENKPPVAPKKQAA